MAQVSNMASGTGSGTIAQATSQDLVQMLTVAHMQYSSGRYTDALSICETIYSIDAYRTENLLLLGAIHFQVNLKPELVRMTIFGTYRTPNINAATSATVATVATTSPHPLLPHPTPPYSCATSLNASSITSNAYESTLTLPRHIRWVQFINCKPLSLAVADAVAKLQPTPRNRRPPPHHRHHHITPQTHQLTNPRLQNLGNALKELGDLQGSVQFYHKSIKLKPRFCDAYNNLGTYM